MMEHLKWIEWLPEIIELLFYEIIYQMNLKTE
jgi:hypothetical protein